MILLRWVHRLLNRKPATTFHKMLALHMMQAAEGVMNEVIGKMIIAIIRVGFARIGSAVFLCAAVAWGACWRLG